MCSIWFIEYVSSWVCARLFFFGGGGGRGELCLFCCVSCSVALVGNVIGEFLCFWCKSCIGFLIVLGS